MNDSQMISSQDCCNNNGSPAKSKIPQLKFTKNAIVHPGKENNSPKLMTNSKDFQSSFSQDSAQTNVSSNIFIERWKAKYQESDRKYKALLIKNEKNLREHTETERKFKQLYERNLSIENQLAEKEIKLNKLRTVSERVYKEYDQLKNQYDVETQAMHQAMQSAGQWYKQNRKLKRQSAALLQKLPPQTIQEWDTQDAVDTASESSAGEELEGLRETVAGLSRQIAKLQTEISSLKLQEFEATELNVNLTQELEQERENNSILEKRVKDLLEENERSKRLSRHLATEVSAFRDQLEQYKSEANQMKCEAESARKERDVLADRSSVYLETISEYEGNPMDKESMQNQEILLLELERLRSQIEEERIMHTKEIDELQGKILDRETSDEMFLLEEKLNLAEDDVRKATERAEKAERLLEEYENKRKSMMTKISLFENQNNKVDDSDKINNSEIEKVKENPQVNSTLLPPPPPPPPPPPAPAFILHESDAKTNSNAIADMANILGIKNSTTTKKKPTGGAIDDIVNQIKGGRFQLKSTEQKEKKPREEPAALKELLNILGTLKRRPKSQREINKELV